METHNAIAFAVASLLTGLFLGYWMRRERTGKIDFLIDNTLLIQENQKTIMATIAELTTKLDELQASVDAEQEQVMAAIATLQATVDELRANQQDPAAVDAAIAKVDAVIADLKSTIPDQTEGE